MNLETIAALYRYDDWANDQVLEAVSGVTQADFDRDLGSGRGSIRDTLVHIVWSHWIWLQRWKGVTPLVFQPADFAHVAPELLFSSEDFPTVESLRDRFRAVAREGSRFLRGLGAEQLQQVMEYETVTGDPWRRPLWRLLYHVVNHASYHRGQVAMMLRQVGGTPLATDFVSQPD